VLTFLVDRKDGGTSAEQGLHHRGQAVPRRQVEGPATRGQEVRNTHTHTHTHTQDSILYWAVNSVSYICSALLEALMRAGLWISPRISRAHISWAWRTQK